MTHFERDGAEIHYTLAGDPDGFPVLLIAPGGLRSATFVWDRIDWHPLRRLGTYRLIGMDQRNAGQSVAPVTGEETWETYTADQLGLLDHLGVDRCHVVGMCIGGPYIMGLLRAAPKRFASAVMLQPVGLDQNRDTFFDLFDGWANEIRDAHPEATHEAWAAYRQAMFGGEFTFNVSREDAAAVRNEVLLFMGSDIYHPESTSRQLAALLQNVTFVESWKDDIERTDHLIQEFLARHTPTG
jgi:pimeloyl-ACP methyl ester carboxylesterase